MINQIIVLGGGSAGLMTALALRKQLPEVQVRIIRSPEIGVIGVGEGTTQVFPGFLGRDLEIPAGRVFSELQPIWKLGIRFLWGPRGEFFYSFSRQFNHRFKDLPRNNGYYCDEDIQNADLWSSLMQHGKAFARQPDGAPQFDQHRMVGFHIENKKLVSFLERVAVEAGIPITDATVEEARLGAAGVESLELNTGESARADLFVDASGFRSELLGRALAEPFHSFGDTIFCDRAVIGGWARTDEPIMPYTVAETMDAGWCWRIEHEHWINRGYVYSSPFISDEAACEEFLRANPKVSTEPRVVRFRAGRYRRMWVGNVVGMGNASGFVEPLEATSLSTIISQAKGLAALIRESFREPGDSMRDLYNRFSAENWDEVRDFLAVHYAFNTLRDTPFWRHCVADTPLNGAADIVEFYRENGPTGVHQTSMVRQLNGFGLEGYLAMLIGQRVPYRKIQEPSAAERAIWRSHCVQHAAAARTGFTVQETLDWIRGHRKQASPAPA